MLIFQIFVENSIFDNIGNSYQLQAPYYLMYKMVQLTQSVINDSIMNFLPNFALDAVSIRPPLLMHISGLSVYHSTLNFLPKKKIQNTYIYRTE